MIIYRKLQKGGPLDYGFTEFRNTLPSNLSDYRGEESYDLHRGWELYGRPKNLFEAWRSGFITPVKEDNNRFHGASIGPEHEGVMEFIKAKNHPTVKKELDWYNSEGGKGFRDEYELIDDENSNYYKYKKRK
jgi:hypothetical protein